MAMLHGDEKIRISMRQSLKCILVKKGIFPYIISYFQIGAVFLILIFTKICRLKMRMEISEDSLSKILFFSYMYKTLSKISKILKHSLGHFRLPENRWK